MSKWLSPVDRLLAVAAVWASLALVLWAAAIFLLQCLGWLKHAQWQPVPAAAMLLSPGARDFHFRMHDGLNALDLVPALGGGLLGIDTGLKGLDHALVWLAVTPPLTGYLVLAAVIAFAFASSLEEPQ
jgi:hypothetical protein